MTCALLTLDAKAVVKGDKYRQYNEFESFRCLSLRVDVFKRWINCSPTSSTRISNVQHIYEHKPYYR